MNIVIVESDPFEIEALKEEILISLNVSELTIIKSVSEAVVAVEQLRRADIIVMEKFLPLARLQTEEEYVFLLERQPELRREGGWDYHEGGEWLIRWMRGQGVNAQVILHINVDKEFVGEDVFEDGMVVYCQKDLKSFNKLFSLIRSMS